jgi:peptide/nickel transport system substrate-binding protein
MRRPPGGLGTGTGGGPGRARRGAAAALLALAALGGCGGGGGADAGGGPGAAGGRLILRVAYDREIDVLNPLTSQNLVDIQFSMIEGLVTTDDRNSYIPVLAREIPTEENGQVVRNPDGTVTMTWRLQENVRWHDGARFTGEDVCFTWRFVTSPGSQVYNRDQYLGITACEIPDPHTVVFTWRGVFGYYAGLFEALLPAHLFEGMTTEQVVNHTPFNRGEATIGTGPFRFAEWRSGEYIRVVRNEDYWRGADRPAIDEIVWSFIPDANTRLNAMKAGRHHWARILPTQVEEVRSLAGYQVHLISQNSFMHLDFSVNTARGRALFSDREVRRALFRAIDRQAIVDGLMQGTVRLADSPINPGSPYHNPDVPSTPYDPDAARRALDAAGWITGADGIRVKDGERFSFTLLNRAGATERIAIAQVVQAQLREVGVEVLLETMESAAWTQRWRSGQWEGIVSAWFLPADPSFTGLYACGGPNNMTGLCDPELDAILQESDRYLDFASRKPALDAAQLRWHESAPVLPLFYNVIPELVSTRVQGYRGSGTNYGSFWNLWEWRLEG